MTFAAALAIAPLVQLLWLPLLFRIFVAWGPTSLRHARWWLLLAWWGWLGAAVALSWAANPMPIFYIALLLSACAFTATLGARLPGMAAWNFVVAGLLMVAAMPLIEQPRGAVVWRVDEPRSIFLAVILFVALLDYLPTRHFLATLSCVSAAAWLLWGLHFGFTPEHRDMILLTIYLLVCGAAWLASLRGHGPGPGHSADAYWLAFRDRYGAAWALRVLEQANQAFKNGNWNVRLTWFGLAEFAEGDRKPEDAEVMEKLRLLLQKFMP